MFRNLFYLFAIVFKVITVDNSHLLPHRIQTSQQLTSGRLSRLAASTKPFPSLKHPKRPSRLRGPRLSRHRTATAQTGQPTCCPISLNRPPTAACALVTSAAAARGVAAVATAPRHSLASSHPSPLHTRHAASRYPHVCHHTHEATRRRRRNTSARRALDPAPPHAHTYTHAPCARSTVRAGLTPSYKESPSRCPRSSPGLHRDGPATPIRGRGPRAAASSACAAM